MPLKNIVVSITKLKKVYLLFLGVVMLIFTHYLMYKNHTQIGNLNKTPLYIFPAFFLFYGGITFLVEICHRVYTIIDKKIETKKRLLKYIYNSATIVLICVSALPYFYYTTKYDKNQLANFGVIQKVVIERTFRYRRSEKASFHINLNDSLIYKELSKKSFSVGDTGTVIFSSQNPNIIKWFNEYTKQ